MNVIITEIYNNEQPVTWIVNKEHATPELRAVIEKAVANDEQMATCDLSKVGFQGGDNEDARVKLPAMIDASIDLYEND